MEGQYIVTAEGYILAEFAGKWMATDVPGGGLRRNLPGRHQDGGGTVIG